MKFHYDPISPDNEGCIWRCSESHLSYMTDIYVEMYSVISYTCNTPPSFEMYSVIFLHLLYPLSLVWNNGIPYYQSRFLHEGIMWKRSIMLSHLIMKNVHWRCWESHLSYMTNIYILWLCVQDLARVHFSYMHMTEIYNEMYSTCHRHTLLVPPPTCLK